MFSEKINHITNLKMRKIIISILLILIVFTSYSQDIKHENSNIKSVAILLYDGFTALDVVGAYQVLGAIMGAEIKMVAKKKGLVQSDNVLSINADYDFSEITQADILLVPGGLVGTYKVCQDKEVLQWIRQIHEKTIYTTSVCTGSWILASAGILQGKNAACHWYGKEILEGFGAKFSEKRWVKEGKIYTAAGVSSGIDMGLALASEIMGEEYAKAIQLLIQYDPKPPFDAGTPSKADPKTVKWLQEMYDEGLKTIKNK
jgi:transcriptional regulator GlxA family with amidase domain